MRGTAAPNRNLHKNNIIYLDVEFSPDFRGCTQKRNAHTRISDGPIETDSFLGFKRVEEEEKEVQ